MYERQQALAAEIRAEAAAQRITAKDIQNRIGVSSSAWSNYFNRCTRDVPMSVVADVAEVLGLDDIELLTRARARYEASGSPSVDRTTAEIEAGLSAKDRELLKRLRAEQAKAGEEEADPSPRARADVDDGIGRTVTWFHRSA